MEIARIEVYQLDLPYSGGTYTLSGGRNFDNFDATCTRVITACGLEGWGESTPFGSTYIAAHGKGVRAGIEEIAPPLLPGRYPVVVRGENRHEELHLRLFDVTLEGASAVDDALGSE